MTRRELLALAATATFVRAKDAPSPPVAIARCASYDEDLSAILGNDVRSARSAERRSPSKTVTIKLNLTGSPGLRFQGKPLGVTHYTHPKTVAAVIAQLGSRRREADSTRGKLLGERRSARRVYARFRMECAIAAVGSHARQGRIREYERRWSERSSTLA